MTMSATTPNSWAVLWDLIRRVQTDKISPWVGLRNALGVALPIAAGVAAGSVPTGLALATGALNVAFTDSSEPYRVRGWRMLAATVLVGFAVATGEVCGNSHILAVAVSTGWAFAAGLLVALSVTAADLGVVSLVTLVVYSSVAASPEHALGAGVLAVIGGLFQTALSLALWQVRPPCTWNLPDRPPNPSGRHPLHSPAPAAPRRGRWCQRWDAIIRLKANVTAPC